ncbi:MAG: hypothetical protein IT539_17615 [Bradyrhizobiaceae bacterium]|nr:hypothetical protein [Bradyrhizobiaceae bacterium]
MWDFSFAATATLLRGTASFMLIRAAVYFGAAAAFVVAAGGGAGIGFALGALAASGGRAPGAFWGALAGIACVALMLAWLHEYLLYLVRASHVAALTLAHDRKRPRGTGPLGHALDLVQQRFRTTENLGEVDRLTRGALADMLRIPQFADALLPAGTQISAATLRLPFRVAFAFLAEVVLARQFRGTARDPWPGTRDALVLFLQNHRALMRNALAVAALTYATTIAVFLLGLIPAAMIARALPGSVAAMAVPLAAIFAWSVKQALLDPAAVASMLQVWFRAIDSARPDTDWESELTRASAHFREIKARAAAAPQGMRRSVVA